MNNKVASINDHARVEAARGFFNSVSGKANCDYDWANDYSRYLWEHWQKVWTRLDEKADSIIKYLGGGTGLFALGILSKAEAVPIFVSLASLVPITIAYLAVLNAIKVRRPNEAPELPTVEAMEGYILPLDKPYNAKAAFLGQWHLACEKMSVACENKSVLLERANTLYWWALLSLLLPIVVAVLLSRQPQNKPCPPQCHTPTRNLQRNPRTLPNFAYAAL